MKKDDILTGYFNIAFFGERSYGIGAAAEHYFGVPVTAAQPRRSRRCSSAWCRTPAPTTRSGTRPTPATGATSCSSAWSTVGYITEAEAKDAEAQPLHLHITKQTDGCQAGKAPYFCDWVVSTLESDPAFGATKQDRTDALLKGGLTIRTTLNWTDERAAEAALGNHLPADKPQPARHRRRRGHGQPEHRRRARDDRQPAVGVRRQGGAERQPLPDRRQLGLPGRLDVQAVHDDRGAAGRHPDHQHLQLAADPTTRPIFPGYAKKSARRRAQRRRQRGRPVQHDAGHRVLGQHLLRPARGEGRRAGGRRRARARSASTPSCSTRRRSPPDEGWFTLGTREVSPLEMAGAYATIAAAASTASRTRSTRSPTPTARRCRSRARSARR